jgi:spore maturation protein CgeB
MAKGPIEDAEFTEFLRESVVLLGLNQGRDSQGRLMSYLKFRDVEFAGYGCCYLTEHNEDIAGIFEPGREVLTYRTMREAAEMIRELGRAPEKARRIGEAGRRRVLAEHTWTTRLKQLAAAL